MQVTEQGETPPEVLSRVTLNIIYALAMCGRGGFQDIIVLFYDIQK